MKKVTLCLLLIIAVSCIDSICFANDEKSETMTETTTTQTTKTFKAAESDSQKDTSKDSNTVTVEKTPGVGYCLLRGLANVGLGVIALPRQIVYENAEIPVLGLLPGVIFGVAECVWREFAGVTDLISFGFSGRGLYFRGMDDFPWSPWLPPEYGK